MVKFGVKDVASAMELGFHAATEVSKKFAPPIKLEFEKVFFACLHCIGYSIRLFGRFAYVAARIHKKSLKLASSNVRKP